MLHGLFAGRDVGTGDPVEVSVCDVFLQGPRALSAPMFCVMCWLALIGMSFVP